VSIVKEKGQVRAIGEYYEETWGVHESDSIVKEKVVSESNRRILFCKGKWVMSLTYVKTMSTVKAKVVCIKYKGTTGNSEL
jgi:hypothetical protein